MVITSYPILLTYLLPSSPLSVLVSTETLLVHTQDHLNIVRRWMRAFRFLEALGASWVLYTRPQQQQQQGRTLDVWLDVLALTSFGLFGMVESITLLDVAPLDGLEVFGAEQAAWMNLEAHKFWFVGLYASAVSSGFKLFRIMAYQPVPSTGTGFAPEEKQKGDKSVAEEKEDMKKAAEKRKEERKKWAAEVSEKTSALGLSLLADVLDLTVPAATLGWVDLSPGVVGSAMLCSSTIMVLEKWKGVGSELDKRA